jgi:hypothetical protein
MIKKNAPVRMGIYFIHVPLKTVIKTPQPRKSSSTDGILNPFWASPGHPFKGNVTNQHITPSCASEREIPLGSGAICDPTAKTKKAAELKQEIIEMKIDK